MMNMMTGAVAINGGVGVMEIRQPKMAEVVGQVSAVAADVAQKDTPLNPAAQAQTEAAEDKRPPGGTEAGTAAVPKKIFVCSPYRPTAENLRCQKSQLEANINRAKTACRILSTLGFLPLAPHLYFTQFLKDEEKKERETGMKLGLHWLEEADELWVFGDTVSEGMRYAGLPIFG